MDDATIPAPCKTLSKAAELVLGMSVAEFEGFEPRTVAEQTAVLLAHRAARGSTTAFKELTEAYERVDDEESRWAHVDEVLVRIRECAFNAVE